MIFGVPFALIFDYLAHISQTWIITSSIFDPYRLLGQVTIESIIWGFFILYFVIIYYESFFDHHLKKRLIYPYTKYSFLFVFFAVSLFGILYGAAPALLNIQHFYVLVGSTLLLIPIILTFTYVPKLIGKFVKTAAFFFYLNILQEIIALKLNHWNFPSNENYIGVITIVGYSLPLEEIIFWLLLSAVGILSYFEFFEDDEK